MAHVHAESVGLGAVMNKEKFQYTVRLPQPTVAVLVLGYKVTEVFISSGVW